MTKVTILGKSQGEEPKKKIEFIYALSGDGKTQTLSEPNEASEIVLLVFDYLGGGLDLMLAKWNNGSKILYLGHFNDGVV